MKLSPVLALAITGVALAPAPVRAEEPSTIQGAYLALRDDGCNVADVGSPIVARALRNVPYAMKGKIFKSADLTALYSADGGWYRPTDPDADVDSADRECVRKLDAREKTLRKKIKIKKSIEEAFTRHTGVVLDMKRLVVSDFPKVSQKESTRDGMRVWELYFEASGGAALVTVECKAPVSDMKAKPPVWSRLECNVLAAG
jgi:hypothetical protein